MSQKGITLCLLVFIIGIIACAKEEFTNGKVSEKLIAQIDLASWRLDSLTASPDIKRVACVAEVGDKQCVVVNGKSRENIMASEKALSSSAQTANVWPMWLEWITSNAWS